MSAAPQEPASPPGSVPPSNIGDLVRSLLDSAIAYVQTRGELLRLESKEASTAVTRKVVLVFFAACAFAFAYALAVTALVFLVHRHYDIPWEYAALGGAGIQVIVAVILIMIAKGPFRRGLFHHTLNEFEKDRQWLQKKSPPTTAENDQAPL
jgi:uncharacterized membrane protein YqjE